MYSYEVDDYSPEEQAKDEAQEVDTTPVDNVPF